MTFSILARDPETGHMGGAAATGSLCVGGWVLRGDARAGMSACQGAAPSTFWGEDTLSTMAEGSDAKMALDNVVGPDPGREWRQLSVLDRRGGTACHSGSDNTDWKGDHSFPAGVVAGNMLAGPHVLEALASGYMGSSGPIYQRLMAALHAANDAGGDIRGLQSAAILVVGADIAPLSLRIDLSDTPLAALEALLCRATSGDYAKWAAQVPCLEDPFRRLSDHNQ